MKIFYRKYMFKLAEKMILEQPISDQEIVLLSNQIGKSEPKTLAKPTPIKDVPSFTRSSSVDSKEETSTTFETNERFIIPFKRVIDEVVEAKVVPVDINDNEIDDYLDNYDEALVTVKIDSSMDSVQAIDNLVINRITTSITAMEVDGVHVVQVKVIEKILEIESTPSNESSNNHQLIKQYRHRYRSPCKSRFAQLKGRLHHWWRCSSKYTRILLTSFLLTFIFSIFFIISHSISKQKYLKANAYKHPIPNYFHDDKKNTKSFERVIFIADEEKKALMEEYK
ncbi:12137_t:CDS:2 [Entrophospora sp. SA101]|nr:5818_t:CDS:2 [Entrophospora sp. SA101]CAJ0630834.1 5820_t:CDS:2 [Entrophospora sp. SA101]CAJ0750883.1 12137_t:CDS:2 [Entrophospora sp. SA101]CAJ0926170.1 21944_t:CDS:2 [Entrophospora sp. SA101]